MGFLPTTVKEMQALGWDCADIILITGDAYIDHPAFGAAVVSRLFEAEGYRVAVVPQPNWRDDLRDFRKLGTPRLCFCVTAGAMDSMVNHYTANIRLRSDDAYTADGKAGFRPDYATITYTKILKELYPSVPVLIGGIEASLRRLTHYDYWSDTLHPSILVDSGADFLLYGMGERTVREVARAMRNGFNAKRLRALRQVAYVADAAHVERIASSQQLIRLHSFEEQRQSKQAFGENFVTIERESNLLEPQHTLVEQVGERFIVVNPMHTPLTTAELDYAAELPYERAPHPRYDKRGEIPAWRMIQHSIAVHRGCFGGCSFCTIAAHQGKFIASRSEESILREVQRVVAMPSFRGTISDIGGPSANMYGLSGRNKELCQKCHRPSCLHPRRCPNLNNDHRPLIELYRKVRSVEGVKHAYIGSGIRYDLFDGEEYLREVIAHHTSGRLKVAPEHTEDAVLAAMRKPSFSLFEELNATFKRICSELNRPYQLIPYFISSHPACRESDMKALASKVLGRLHFTLEQVQDLTPTPMTLSSVMFYTGENPYTHKKLYTARTQEEKRRQKSYFFDKRQKSSTSSPTRNQRRATVAHRRK